ncbi:hypothetical protein LR48_Vigan11g077200 [Vigna angularis]|uniref:Uncharacterized protein n=1 Tax=Phaseolus angularis TaxID=3914 RepID=A0A0L9VSJ9_PHAAN|nr:hypothetical protein LR48_Vigan11g077200 [Vigna angularis]
MTNPILSKTVEPKREGFQIITAASTSPASLHQRSLATCSALSTRHPPSHIIWFSQFHISETTSFILALKLLTDSFMVLGFSAIDFVSLSFLRVRSQSRTSFPFRCVFTLWRKLRGARTASVVSFSGVRPSCIK